MNCPNCISSLVSPEGGIAWCMKCSWPAGRELSFFTQGDRVRYVPFHAHYDPNHEDCQDGIAVSVGRYYNIWVLFDTLCRKMRFEDIEQFSATATGPGFLVKL